MAETIDTAYVRIRPSVTGFQAEAGHRIRGALVGVQGETTRAGVAARGATRDFDRFGRGLVLTEARALGLHSILGSVSAAFVGGVGIASVIHTATEEFANFTRVGATTTAILNATGGAAHVTATGVQALATAIEHKTGIDDEQVRSAENVLLTFRAVRNEVGRGNDVFDRATRAAADLSSVFGTDVASTARQLGRALQDPTRGLLTLRRAGLTFTAAQVQQIKALADTGQVLRAQTIILDEVDRRVGGTAETVGRTLPGQLNILRERAKDALGEYVRRLSESRDAAEAAREGGADLAAGFHVVEAAVRAVGPPLVTVARAAHAAVDAIGGTTILAAVVGYRSVGAAIGLAARGQALYARAAATAAGANTVTAASAEAVAAATRVETTSLAGSTFALRGVSTVATEAAAANAGLAASETAVGIAARASAIGVGAGRLALAAVGGPVGAAAIGVGALAAGFIVLRRDAANAAGGLNSARHALDDFNASVRAGRDIRVQVSGAQEAIRQARQAQQAAGTALTQAQTRAGRSTAPAGSLERRALDDRVEQARIALSRSTIALDNAERRLDTARARREANQRRQPAVISATTRGVLAQIAALRQLALSENNKSRGLGAGVIIDPNEQRRAERALQRFQDLTAGLRRTGTGLDRVVGTALNRIATSIHGLPDQKQVRIVLRLAAQGQNADAILAALGIRTPSARPFDPTVAAMLRLAGATREENTALQQQFAAAQRILRTDEKQLATRRAAAATARQEAQAARDAVQNAADALTNANQQLADSQRALADSITAGRAAVNAAVRDAKTNLRSIGDSIADAIGRFAEQGAQHIGPAGPLGRRFRELRDQIIAGRGGPDTQRAAQEVAARLQAQQGGATDDVAARAKRRLDDLSDSFSRGRIGAGQFNAGVQRVLHDFGLNLRTFGQRFGSAALNDLRDQLTASRQQAAAITAGPRRPGGGGEPNIIRPLDAVAAAQRDTRNATRDVTRATREVARAQREISQKQLAEERAHTRELRAIRVAVQAQARVARQQQILKRPKPTGRDGKTAQDSVTAGAGSP